MSRLSIARALETALVGLALALAVIAGLGIAALYDARQRYEDELASTYELEAVGARALAASVVEESLLAQGSVGERRRAGRAFVSVAAAARRLAAGDRPSRGIVEDLIAAQTRARRLAFRSPGSGGIAASLARARRAVDRLAARQDVRRAQARDAAASASRRALITVGLAGGLALVAAATLVTLLIGALRRPLAALVDATSRLAGGQLGERVTPEGPRELVDLGEAFNAMAADLETARARIDAERQRLAVIVESLGDALIVCDAAGRVEQVNPRARELVPQLAPGADAAGPGSPLPELERSLGRETQVEHGGATLSVVAARLGGAADAGFVWTVRDATERARLERLKSEFVATASHELRSPLTSIKGFIELLSTSERLDARQREFVDIILVSANRLVDLVNDLLDVARAEAGAIEIEARSIDVAPVVREVATLLGPRLAEKEHELELDLDSEVPRALADPARVRQIVTNLLTNAHAYTQASGKLGVRLGTRDGNVTIQVSDTGQGISADQLPHVFDRFYRARSGQGAAGTGLGLAIVRSLVDLHGGSVAVDSRVGEGTTFTVCLPAAPTPSDAHAVARRLKGRRVLVVDDEPAIARLVETHLTALGVETLLAHSGEVAIELLRRERERVDAVTLDVLMPGMSGFEVLEEIRSDPRLSDLPVVVVSVMSGRGALAGEAVVSKPIDAEQLAITLSGAVTRARSRVLAIARPSSRESAEQALRELGARVEWAARADEVARLCEAHRFEIALVDAGIPALRATLDRLDLRGRRAGQGVFLFSMADDAPGVARLGHRPQRLGDAIAAVAVALSGTDGQDA